MPCPNCSHTLHRLNAATIHGDFTADYCPRCGTLIESDGPEDPREPTITTPKLVERCREFEDWCQVGIGWNDTNTYKQWTTLGIAEAIHKPEDRK